MSDSTKRLIKDPELCGVKASHRRIYGTDAQVSKVHFLVVDVRTEMKPYPKQRGGILEQCSKRAMGSELISGDRLKR